MTNELRGVSLEAQLPEVRTSEREMNLSLMLSNKGAAPILITINPDMSAFNISISNNFSAPATMTAYGASRLQSSTNRFVHHHGYYIEPSKSMHWNLDLQKAFLLKKGTNTLAISAQYTEASGKEVKIKLESTTFVIN